MNTVLSAASTDAAERRHEEDMMELRMLSGLHRGAVLELDEQELLLGAGDDVDVIVVDPGIAALHLRIRKEADAFVLVPEEGDVWDEQGTQVTGGVVIARGSRFRIGEIWIGFYHEEDAWQGLPAAQDAPRTDARSLPAADKAVPEEMPMPDDLFESTPDTMAALMEEMRAEKGIAPVPAPSAMPAPTETAASPRTTAASGNRFKRSALIVAILLALAPVLVWVANLAYASFRTGDVMERSPQGEQAIAAVPADRAPQRILPPPTLHTALPPAGTPATVVPAAPAMETPKPEAAAPVQAGFDREQLASELRRQLADRELLDRVDLIEGMSGSGWELRGALDAEEKDRVQRLADNFARTHKLPFVIHVRIIPLKDMLPFAVVEVSRGSNSNIVTSKGDRLFIGDTVDGYRLVSITPNKIIFSGKRQIELPW